MAKLPIGKGAAAGAQGTRRAVNLDELTRKASYIVDEAGQKQAIVVEWSAWQEFVRRLDAGGGIARGATPTGHNEPEYALHQDRTGVDLYRPKLATRKEAADFTLETTVTRRGGD